MKKLFRRNNNSNLWSAAALLILFTGCSTTGANNSGSNPMPQGMAGPSAGLMSYTMHHAMMPNPTERIGGPVTITLTQENGNARWTLPGPRDLDPAVFGTPSKPLALAKGPFPMVVPLHLRLQKEGKYTIVNHATPFGDWMESSMGDVNMKVTDATAIDGMSTQDKIDFEATFKSPDGAHDYRVVAKKPLPHGMIAPTFGGVVTDHLMHGATGIGSPLMPTQYVYVSFWAMGQVYVDGKLVNDNQLIHAMLGEMVRGDRAALQPDSGVGGGGTGGKVLHLMVPPYRVGPKGLEKAPLKTGYIPFPAIKKRMMEDKQAIMMLPPEKKKPAMARMMAVQKVMMETKEKAQKAMAAGRMFGQPFMHIMFGHTSYDVSYNNE